MLSAGKVRRLTEVSSTGGVFNILAVDHRDSMRAALMPDDPDGVTARTMTETKLDLVEGVGDLASAVLLDPEYSAFQAVADRALRGDTAFLCALEAQGYMGDPQARVTTVLEGWSVEKAVRVGASGIKLLLLYRPDSAAAADQERLVEEVVADCARYEIPLFLEPVSYEADGPASPSSAQYGSDRKTVVCESARRLGSLGPDVLKLQFPADTSTGDNRSSWSDACAELNEASPVPWALLSGGGPFESFRDQVRIACEGGASGFVVGRALWGDYVTAPLEQRQRLLESVVRPRFAELTDIAIDTGADWASRFDLPIFDEGAYAEY
jgi:tagatose-1,6-bisphosphate aldolase